MKRICLILLSVLLFSCNPQENKVRDNIYDAKILVIEENHEKLIEAITVSEVIEILEAVKAGCQTEDARFEMTTMMESRLDTASIRASGEKLSAASNLFVQRTGTKLQDMSPTWEETSQLVRLIKSIKESNSSYRSYFAENKPEKKIEKKVEKIDDEKSDSFNIDLENLPSFESLFSVDTLLHFFTDEHGDFDLDTTVDTLGQLLKIVAVIAALF